MILLIVTLLIAFLITNFTLPQIIKVAEVKNLGVVPNHRSSHTNITPSLGGIGILAGILTPILLFGKQLSFWGFSLVFIAIGIVFLIGLKDDLIEMKPLKKLFGQLIAASLVVYSGIKLTSLHGIMGIDALPEWLAYLISVFTIIVIMNSFNLIDGINGLSGGMGLLVATVLGSWFYMVNQLEFALIAFALAGSLIGFLRYNITPAKIFMGDSGSLVIGLIIALLTIWFIEFHLLIPENYYTFKEVPAIAISILILPLFDTGRVFFIRIVKGRSPLSADRHHIHHMLIDAGFSHTKATLILVLLNASYIFLAMVFQDLGTVVLLSIILISSLSLTLILRHYVIKKRLYKPISIPSPPNRKPVYRPNPRRSKQSIEAIKVSADIESLNNYDL